MPHEDFILHPRRKGEDGYKVFSIRIPDKTAQRLDDLSAKSNRSRNEVIGLLLNYALDHCILGED